MFRSTVVSALTDHPLPPPTAPDVDRRRRRLIPFRGMAVPEVVLLRQRRWNQSTRLGWPNSAMASWRGSSPEGAVEVPERWAPGKRGKRAVSRLEGSVCRREAFAYRALRSHRRKTFRIPQLVGRLGLGAGAHDLVEARVHWRCRCGFFCVSDSCAGVLIGCCLNLRCLTPKVYESCRVWGQQAGGRAEGQVRCTRFVRLCVLL